MNRESTITVVDGRMFQVGQVIEIGTWPRWMYCLHLMWARTPIRAVFRWFGERNRPQVGHHCKRLLTMKTKTLLILSAVLLFSCAPMLAVVQAAPPVAVASIPWAVKAIAIAAVVSAAIQGIKTKFPITGHLAQLINGVGAVSASLALSAPGDWKTPTFWLQIVLTFQATAGVHDLASFWGLFRSGK